MTEPEGLSITQGQHGAFPSPVILTVDDIEFYKALSEVFQEIEQHRRRVEAETGVRIKVRILPFRDDEPKILHYELLEDKR